MAEIEKTGDTRFRTGKVFGEVALEVSPKGREGAHCPEEEKGRCGHGTQRMLT